MELNYELIGKRVKNIRIKCGLTQAELAEKIEVSNNFMGKIERGYGKLGLHTLIKISNELSVSTDYLLQDILNREIKTVTDDLIQIVSQFDDKDKRLLHDLLCTFKKYKND